MWSPQRLLSQGLTAAASEIWAAPAFVVVFALATLAFFPKPVLNVAAGALFGIPEGLALAVPGTTLGAALAFALGRSLGRDGLRPLLKKKILAALDRKHRSRLSERPAPSCPAFHSKRSTLPRPFPESASGSL